MNGAFIHVLHASSNTNKRPKSNTKLHSKVLICYGRNPKNPHQRLQHWHNSTTVPPLHRSVPPASTPGHTPQQCPRLNRRAAQRRKPPRTPRYIPGQTPQHRSRSNRRATQCRQHPRARRHTPQQRLRPKCRSPSSTPFNDKHSSRAAHLKLHCPNRRRRTAQCHLQHLPPSYPLELSLIHI